MWKTPFHCVENCPPQTNAQRKEFLVGMLPIYHPHAQGPKFGKHQDN